MKTEEQALFAGQAPEHLREWWLAQMGKKPVSFYRTRTWKAGELIEAEIYPIYERPKGGKREHRAKPTREAMQRVNDTNTRRKITRYINANFTEMDIWLTVTYAPDKIPATPEEARKDLQAWLRRIKRRRARNGMGPPRYLYVTEWADKDGKPTHAHHHIVMDGELDRDTVEKSWGKGRTNCRRLQPDDFGLSGLSAYISKGKRHAKRWGRSKGLKYPTPTVADHKISKRQARRIAENEHEAQEVFKKAFPAARLLDIEVRYSEVIPGAYIYARLKKELRRKKE